jgi:uncharacterized integral membrane protein
LVVAQVAVYTTEQTTAVTISSDGTFNAIVPDLGVSYSILGTPGATGTVTADVYAGNPQPTASVPAGTSLTHFVAITFNMNASDFLQATFSINYTASDVQNIQSTYALYKYMPDTNSYVALNSTVVDTNTKTITVTVNSITDPFVLAIGGTASKSAGVSGGLWVVIIVTVIMVVLLAVFIVSRLRRESSIKVLDTRLSR